MMTMTMILPRRAARRGGGAAGEEKDGGEALLQGKFAIFIFTHRSFYNIHLLLHVHPHFHHHHHHCTVSQSQLGESNRRMNGRALTQSQNSSDLRYAGGMWGSKGVSRVESPDICWSSTNVSNI